MSFELTPEQQPTLPATGVGAGTPVRRDRERLARLLAPRSVALIGVSDDPARVTGRPLRYLRTAGFPGPVYITRPRYDSALTGDTLEEMALAAEGAGAADEVGAAVAAVTGAGS